MDIFPNKSDAIKFINKCSNKDIHLFQEDINKGGSKRFIVCNYDKIFNYIMKNKNNLYESWLENSKLHFGLDLDITNNKDDYENIVLNIIKDIIKVAKEKYNINIKANTFYLSKVDDEKNKVSIHITCKALVFENYKACKQFYDKLEKNPAIDDSIYRLTCLRMCYNQKFGKNNILKPFRINIDSKSKTAITPDNDKNKKYWLNTLLTNVDKKLNVIEYIKSKEVEKVEKVEVNQNIELEALLFKLPLEYCNDYNKWWKVAMVCYSENNYKVFDKWSKQSKNYDGINNKKIWDNIKDYTGKKVTIGSLIYWLKENNVSNPFSISIEETVNKYPKTNIIITENYKIKKINKEKLDVESIKYGMNKKLFAIQSEKGTGKTTSLIKYLFENGRKEPESILFISSRRTFGIKLLSDLSKYGFKLYSDIEEHYINENRVIVQLDSLMRVSKNEYDLIIVDECESLARYMTGKHFNKNSNSSLIICDLEYRIGKAKNTIIMDADLSDRCIHYYKNIINSYDGIDIDKELRVLINENKPYEKYKMKYLKFDNWAKLILNKVKENKKLIIPMASNNKAKDLEILLKNKYPMKNILLIHKETSDEDKLQRLLNVNTDWVNFDIVIYTPTVCMGVSFDIPNYFDYIFCYGCHNSLGAQEFCQMLHRVRQPKYKTIYISIDMYKYFDITEDLIDYKIVEEMICSDYYLTKYDIHNNLIPKKFGRDRLIEYKYKTEPIYDLYVRNCKERIENENNFSASFFGYVKNKGYNLTYIDNVENDFDVKSELKRITKNRKEEDMNILTSKLVEAKMLSKKEYEEKIKRKDEYMDEETLYEIKKYNLKDCYNIDNPENIDKEFIETYYDRSKMLNYNNLSSILNIEGQNTDRKIKVLKVNEEHNIELLNVYEEFKHKNMYVFHYYPNILFKYLGIDINELENKTINKDYIKERLYFEIEGLSLKEFIEKEFNSLCFKFNLHRKKLNLNNECKVIEFINKILIKQYGIRFKKSKDDYKLTSDGTWDNLPRDEKIIVKKLKERINLEEDNDNYLELLDDFVDSDDE